jgi:hypothetical protein
LKTARRVIAIHRRYLQESHGLDWLRAELSPLRAHIQELLEQGASGRHNKTANFCSGLLEEYDALWTFCEVKNIEIPTTMRRREHSVTPSSCARSSSAPSHSKVTAGSSGYSQSERPCACKTARYSTT